MRPVRYNVAASLDGFIADAEGRFDWIPEDPTVDFAAIFARVDTILIGRKSWEQVRRMGGEKPWTETTRVYVFSSSLAPADVAPATLVCADVAATVSALRHEPDDREIWLFGGGELFASLLALGQVDRVEITVVPVLLGAGVPVLPGGPGRVALDLLETKRYPSGMVTLSYSVPGAEA